MAHDVFICYSSKDKTTADAVCAVLESEGIRCWIAPRDILVGMSYGEAIVNAIHNAKALVLVFSGHANASPQIEREVERAINQRIPVIPLRIEDVAPDKALEYFLSTPHWLDAFTPPLDRHLRNLAAQIRRLINMPDPPPAPAATAAPIGSPFKAVHTEAPAPDPLADVTTPIIPAPPPAPPPPSMAAEAKPTPPSDRADAKAASVSPLAFGAAGVSASGSVPSAARTKPATSPTAFFSTLDTSQKIGIGAGALVVLIGLGWAISSNTGSPVPGPMASAPGIDGKPSPVAQAPETSPSPSSSPQFTSNPPSGNSPSHGTNMPSDGDVIPGRSGPSTPAPSGTAMLADGSFNAVTGSDIAGVMSDAGYDAQAMRNNDGDPMIQGTIEGLKFAVYFYRCNRQAQPESCMDLQFHSVFTNDNNVGDEALNKYNRDNRFGQAFFMQNGDIGLDMSATLQGGVTRQHIKEVIDWWKVTLTGFTQKVGG